MVNRQAVWQLMVDGYSLQDSLYCLQISPVEFYSELDEPFRIALDIAHLLIEERINMVIERVTEGRGEQ